MMISSKELFDKRNKAASKLWERFPETLRHILITMDRSNGEYGASEALRYLNEHKVSPPDHSGTSKLDYLRWVDRVFRDILYPVFNHEDLWENRGDEIEEILARAESYLHDLTEDYERLSVMSRDERGFYDSADLVTIAQDLDMFFCIMYWYKKEDEQFDKKLIDIFEATKRNVSYLLQHEYAADLKELDFYGMEDYLPMRFYYWENIAWLYHFGGAAEFTLPLIKTYEEYINYLQDLDVGSNWKIRDEISVRAEEDLQFLYELDIDRKKDEIPEDEYLDYVEQCELKIQESKDRVEIIRNTQETGLQTHECESISEEERDMVKKWEESCRVLRNEMGRISYSTWIEPLSIHHVDRRNSILYLKGPKQEKLIEHINERYLGQIEAAVKMFSPELEYVVIRPYDPEVENKHYHQLFGGFTNDLRSLMLSYPTMPVVIFSGSESGGSEQYVADVTGTEVVEGYVHDPESGEFTEKIIAVYVNRPEKIDNDRFIPSEDEVPF